MSIMKTFLTSKIPSKINLDSTPIGWTNNNDIVNQLNSCNEPS